MTALDQLERIAARRGWRLRWKAEPLADHPRVAMTELDILVRGKVIGGTVRLTAGAADARQAIAEVVLRALPRRSPPAVAAYGGRA